MELSIIIVNFNSLSYIKKCIESMFSILKTEGFKWEVVVVDNNSHDGSIDYFKNLQSQFDNFMVIASSQNNGFAKASDIGVGSASGEFLLFLNPDTEFIETGMQKVLDFFNSKNKMEKIGIVGAKLLNSDDSIQHSCRSFPTLARQFYESYFLYRIFSRSKIFGSYFLSYWNHENIREVDWLSGAFMLIKKEVFERIGGFDEDYFMYSEDADICLRLSKAGFKNYYFSQYSIKHNDGGVASGNKAQRNSQIWNSRRLYFIKNYSPVHALFESHLFFPGVVNRLMVFSIIFVFKFKNKIYRERISCEAKTLRLYFSRKV
ncbi:MAG: glycosyltransferase family 2 protein [Actinobacteria bacterium]|nr:glycosyltransferase family 2 protein [Actinomycetota bacterium]